MQKGNVAISSDYSFMFKDRGLSFVLLDQLTQEDLMNKQLVDHRDEMARQFQKEYREYLQKEALEKIASEQRTETVEKSSLSLKDKTGKWLHPDRENDKDKSEEKGE